MKYTGIAKDKQDRDSGHEVRPIILQYNATKVGQSVHWKTSERIKMENVWWDVGRG